MGATEYPDELYHYQVKGAKHGVRRYQNYDGSLTPLGRIHYGIGINNNKQAKKVADKKKSEREAAGKKPTKNEKVSNTAMKKSIAQISDSDLVKYTDRLRKENDLVSARLSLAESQTKLKKYMHSDYVEKPKSKWKQIAVERILIPTVTNVGKDYLEKMARDALNLQPAKQNQNNKSSK